MPTATITSKGQVTIPAEVRKRLGLKAGDRIDFVFRQDGNVVLKSKRIPFEELRGIVRSRRRKPLSIRDMHKVIEEAAVERFVRATRTYRNAK